MSGYRVIKREIKNARFVITDCVQGQPMDYYCKTLLGALFLYAKHYVVNKKKYKTMNISLKEKT